MVHFEDHFSGSDPFITSETTARGNWYGVTGVPTVFFDGIISQVGAYTNCNQMANVFQGMFNQRMAQTDGMSPVSIGSQMTVTPQTATVTATYRLLDPVPLPDIRATILLYEDSVHWCCGYNGVSNWMHVTRKIYDQNITLTNPGDQVTVTANIPIGTGWRTGYLKAVAYLQSLDTKEIIQGQVVGYNSVPDYSLYYPSRLESVPQGNGIASFQASLTNIGSTTDTYTLQPGTPFGSWTTDFLVCGDNTPHNGPFQITLDPNQTCNFTVRVHTDSAKEVRTGTFEVTSQNSGRLQQTTMRVFNGSYAVLVVKNDGTGAASTPIVDGLNALGYLFDTWDVNSVGRFPIARDESGYDMLIWETGTFHTTMGTSEIANLMSYIDGGGALFFTSQYYLNSLGGQPNAFVTNYLGVGSWTLDKGYDHLTGVAGDPIGDGLDLPENFQYPSFKKGDDAVPGPTATTDLLANDGSHAMIRNTMPNGRKVVFEAEDFSAISETNPPPNNTQTVLQRILSWLAPTLAGVPDGAALQATRIDAIRPNPAQQNAQISFALSAKAAAGRVSLEIFDLSGRRIAPVFDGHLEAGAQMRTWDGLSATGAPVESGVYFARLTTADGVRSAKLILVK